MGEHGRPLFGIQVEQAHTAVYQRELSTRPLLLALPFDQLVLKPGAVCHIPYAEQDREQQLSCPSGTACGAAGPPLLSTQAFF